MLVGVLVEVGFGLAVIVRGAGVTVRVTVGAGSGSAVTVTTGAGAGVSVSVGVGVGVGFGVAVTLGVVVAVGLAVGVLVTLGVGVGVSHTNRAIGPVSFDSPPCTTRNDTTSAPGWEKNPLLAWVLIGSHPSPSTFWKISNGVPSLTVAAQVATPQPDSARAEIFNADGEALGVAVAVAVAFGVVVAVEVAVAVGLADAVAVGVGVGVCAYAIPAADVASSAKPAAPMIMRFFFIRPFRSSKELG